MESKTTKAAEAAAGAGATADAREQDGAPGKAPASDSCCVFETRVKEGRVVTECVATCCGAAPAA